MKLGDIGEEMVATAIALAKERGAAIEAITVVRVPRKFALEGELPADVAARVDASLEEARALGADYGVEVHGDVVRARSIGHAIVDEAERRHADLIVLGSSPRWRRQSRFFSPTVDFVLRARAVRGARRRVPRRRLRGVGCAARERRGDRVRPGRIRTSRRASPTDGWDVTVVDENEDALATARSGLAWRLRRRARDGRRPSSSAPALETADAAVVATNGDNTNIVIGQVLQKRYEHRHRRRPRPRSSAARSSTPTAA